MTPIHHRPYWTLPDSVCVLVDFDDLSVLDDDDDDP
jgi:hypothetical protein